MSDRPVKVLQVLGSLNRGGAETWVTQLLECLDRRRVRVDVLVHNRGGSYEEQVRKQGAEIFFCGQPSQVLKYSANLKRLLIDNGPYDVVHSHLQVFSGAVLRAAYQVGIPGRIAHARNSQDGRSSLPHRYLYRALMRHWIRCYATHLFAVSTEAAEGAFWKGVVRDGQCRIMTGIDFSAFQAEYDRAQIRAELGIPASSLVVGHVASFRHQKNHRFLVEIAQELLLRQPDAIFLLVGKGELKPSIEQLVHTRGIDHAFRFLGERTDVARILHAADVFVLPSLYEGLPRVLLEAQAAGLPCIASNNITSEASAWPGSVLYLGPSDSPQIWAQNVIEAAQASLSPTRGQEVIRRFEDRGLTITANAKELTDLYETIAGR